MNWTTSKYRTSHIKDKSESCHVKSDGHVMNQCTTVDLTVLASNVKALRPFLAFYDNKRTTSQKYIAVIWKTIRWQLCGRQFESSIKWLSERSYHIFVENFGNRIWMQQIVLILKTFNFFVKIGVRSKLRI